MKILYCILEGKSGGDIYFKLLKETQTKLDNITYSKSYHRLWSICPTMLFLVTKIDPSYDIIHSNIEYGYAFYMKNKPLIVSALHIISEEFITKYYHGLQKLYYLQLLKNIKKTATKASYIITISKATEQELKRLVTINNNVQTIYCGIDTLIYQPQKIDTDPYPDKIKLLFVGNLTIRKGVDLLPQIMEKLSNKFLLFYTTGMRTAPKIFSDDRMIPLGTLSVQELVYWYNLCDICLLPTRLEGFGYAVAEAMACGKPVVTTNCSSLPEIVVDGETGFLCKIDDVDDFVDKIKMLADNEAMRITMGTKGRQRIVEHFNIDKMGDEYYKMYKQVMKEFYGGQTN
ncbi:MAG: glycosyltransferase family 4 protein, partial [candidate division WOR-3 bacterium]|nr:glycosyltransferase family 4 protein [candidate division WOR-3 bacterium]MCX7757866.1 glycosyltransferase family 4 protein [candidate division WOR-3 bacterium]MDW7988357.1 glycosyltransferase family 4 protein [candidate division WOR-3 bacterium]